MRIKWSKYVWKIYDVRAVQDFPQVDDSYKSHYKGSVVPSASRRTYLAMVTALDEQVGRLVDALKQNGLWNNTVFIFYSDVSDIAATISIR